MSKMRSSSSALFAALRMVTILLCVFVVVVAVGFVWFSVNIWRSSAPEMVRADAIVVLTGASRRIDDAVQLLDQGYGKRLLISGVNPSTSAESIRKLTGGDSKLFECCVDIGYEATTTYGNAAETSAWINKNGFRSVIVVTSGYHLPRSLFELRHTDPETTFIGYPVRSVGTAPSMRERMRLVKIVAAEYVKFIGAHIRAYVGVAALPGESPPNISASR